MHFQTTLGTPGVHLARFGARTPHRPIHSLSLKTQFWAIFECFCDALCGPPHVFESLVLHSITPKTHDFTKLKGFTHVCYFKGDNSVHIRLYSEKYHLTSVSRTPLVLARTVPRFQDGVVRYHRRQEVLTSFAHLYIAPPLSCVDFWRLGAPEKHTCP